MLRVIEAACVLLDLARDVGEPVEVFSLKPCSAAGDVCLHGIGAHEAWDSVIRASSGSMACQAS